MALHYSLKSGRVVPPALLFFSQDALAIQGFFVVPYNFRIICFHPVKNIKGILIGITLNL